MIIPQLVTETQGSRLVIIDYPDDFAKSVVVAGDGTAKIVTDPVPLGLYWRAERITTIVSQTSDGVPIATPGGATLGVYKSSDGSIRPGMYRDGSSAPGLDVADQSQPIIVQPGQQLVFYYIGLTPGTYVAISMQYALMRIIGGS